MELTPAQVKEMRSRISINAVRDARVVISRHLPRTPLIRHPVLAEELDLDLYIKHENHLPTGAFKVRGGMNFMARLDHEKRRTGVVTATRGNHGQSIALAARAFGVPCTLVVPHGNNPEKNATMKAYGARLIEHGIDFDEARDFAEALAEREGLAFVSSGNTPELINGVATYSLEILEDLPDVGAVIIPIGGGSGICGAVTVFRALKPDVKIIGVQAEGAPAVHDSWRAGHTIPRERATTIADGLATRVPYELPLSIMLEGLDEIVLVSDDEIADAIRLILRATHNLAEGAGAAPIAAARKLKSELTGMKVAAVLSGGNIDTALLRRLLDSVEEPNGAGARTEKIAAATQ